MATVTVYEKAQTDTLLAAKIASSSAGVANGVAKLNSSGQVIDASGSVISGGGSGAVSSVNSHTGDVVLTATDVSAVSALTTINGKALSGSVALAVADITGAVPNTLTVAGHALSGNVTITASDVGAATASQGTLATNAVPQTTTINGHALTASVTLAASDVSALPNALSGNQCSSVVVVSHGATAPTGLPDGTVIVELSA